MSKRLDLLRTSCRMKKRLTIGLVYDLRDDYLEEGWSPEQAAEFDSLSTIEALQAAIVSNGHQVERIGNGKRLCAELVAGRRWDLVFNIAEGVKGRNREAQVPALLELFEVPYTFSDPLVCAVTLGGAMAKRLVRDAGLNTPPFTLIESEDQLASFNWSFQFLPSRWRKAPESESTALHEF